MVVASKEEVQGAYVPAIIPTAARAASMILTCLSLAIISVCIIRRTQNIKSWRKLSVAKWLLIGIYLDSFMFVFGSAVTKDIGINASEGLCEAAILICICFYFSTKALLYFFLVERVHIVRQKGQTRLEDKLYLFNCFGMMLPYLGVVIVSTIWRVAFINTDGTCIVGIRPVALIPIIVFDIVVNAYCTALFIMPIRRLHSYRSNSRMGGYLHTIALRCCIGSCCLLTFTIGNAVTMMILKNEEPGWLCFLICNVDVLFTVVVLHWMSQEDSHRQCSYKDPEDNAPPASSEGPKLGHQRIDSITQTSCTATHSHRAEELETDKTRVIVGQELDVEADGRNGRNETSQRTGSKDEIIASSKP